MSRPQILFIATILLVVPLAGCFGEPEDDDGLDRDVEEQGWEVTITLADGSTETRQVSSSPSEADADGDGLDDFIEMAERLDPNDPDTDRDGLLDGKDVFLEADDEGVEDWKDRGIAHDDRDDGVLFLGERGDDTESRGGDPLMQDTDGDGLVDGQEAGGYEVVVQDDPRAVTTLVRFEDTDGDGLEDGEERTLGLDPTLRDTDGDDVPDAQDVDPWNDVKVRFHVEAITLTDSGSGGRDVWMQTQGLGEGWTSPAVRVDGDEDLDTFTSPVLDPDDVGGDIRLGAHNMTFSLSALARDGSGDQVALDLFSEQVDATFLLGRFHALDATLAAESDSGATPEANLTTSGVDGSITFRLEKV